MVAGVSRSLVIARISTGASPGLALRNRGGFGRPAGRSLPAALIAARTSRAAASTLRERSNCTTIEVVPRDEVDVISVTAAMVPSRRSRGAATDEAIVAGSAPGWLAVTTTVGR